MVDRVSQLAAEAGGASFAKTALAGCGGRADWPALWRRSMSGLPADVARVAVAYADHDLAQAPAPHDVLRQARACHCSVMLLDTFTKTRGGLLDYLPPTKLRDLVREIRRAGLAVVLGGSLNRAAIRQVLDINPDLVAVRGAVCREGRTGELDQDLVAQLADLLRETAVA